MVAYYLSNTQKILIGIIPIVLFFSTINQNNKIFCEDISSYLQMKIEFADKNVSYNDSLFISIKFKNVTKDSVEFYPYSLIYLAKKSEGFAYSSKILNEALNTSKLSKLGPDESMFFQIKTNVDSEFFLKGINHIRLVHFTKKLTGELKVFNRLCGYIESDEILVNVIK